MVFAFDISSAAHAYAPLGPVGPVLAGTSSMDLQCNELRTISRQSFAISMYFYASGQLRCMKYRDNPPRGAPVVIQARVVFLTHWSRVDYRSISKPQTTKAVHFDLAGHQSE